MSKTKENSRITFKAGVPETLFKQAGGKCSVPRCKNPTMGPFYEQEGAVNMGTACHIYSASKVGPRGWGGKDEQFIGSEKNGIWCCSYHGTLIDKSNGRDYPAPMLFAWKNLAEARVRKQMNDIPSPLGWIDSIEYTKFFGDKLPYVKLSRFTLIHGRNGSGKSALFEAAAAVCHSKYIDRIASSYHRDSDGNKNGVSFDAKIIYSTVDHLSKEVCLSVENFCLKRSIGNNPCLLPPGDIEVIICSEDEQSKNTLEDDIDFFTRALNIDKSALLELVRIGPGPLMPGSLKFVQAVNVDEEGFEIGSRHKENGDPYLNLYFLGDGKKFEVSYNGLSHSEKGMLLCALLVAKAREVAKQRLTLLLIDGLANYFDAGNFEHLLRKISNEDFQIIMCLPPMRHRDILEEIDGKYQLRGLDYLTNWKLEEIGGPKPIKSST